MTRINKSISVSTKLSNKHSCVETDRDLFVQTFVSSVLAIFTSVFTAVTCNDIKIVKFKLSVCVCARVCVCVCVCVCVRACVYIYAYTFTNSLSSMYFDPILRDLVIFCIKPV